MNRIALTIAALVAALAFGAVAVAGAFAPSDAGGVAAAEGKLSKGRTHLRILGRSQKKILKKGAIKVRVSSTRSRKLKLKARSSTFDHPKLTPIARPKKVKLPKSGKEAVKLRLTRKGEKQLAACELRDIQVTAPHSKETVPMRRNSAECKPGPIDLTRANDCDFIAEQDDSLCLLPFPDDYYTAPASTRTGKRVDLTTAGMPANSNGVHIDAAPYNRNDGFSPGSSIVVKAPGLDTPAAMAATDPVTLDALDEYSRRQAPIVVIDEQTGERWPIWTELDSNAANATRRALLIHPAVNFTAGHSYIVAMRNLRDAGGQELKAPDGFRYFRDGIPSPEQAIKSQRDRYESIFRTLREARIDRADLYLAWNFTVASDENIAERVLYMRDQSLADLGDPNLTDLIPQGDAPTFNVISKQDFLDGPENPPTNTQDPNMARRVQGTFDVPCYLFPDCGPGGRMQLDAQGMPQRNGTYTANFNCMIPRSAIDGVNPPPARASLYGHGLLGSANEATSDPQKTLGNGHNIASCATDEIGLSNSDIPNTIGILSNLSRFPELADRLQQGLLNEIYLGRLMINPDGFASSPDFRVGPDYVIDPDHLYYNGNSQGAIEGGALTAISPDLTRASLGVGGMNYSVLLNRSKDFDQYGAVLNPAYPDELERPLVLSLIQMLWDRGESNGYAHRLTDDPLPNTPPHEVLMNIGLGDQQVTNFQAEVMARTVGAQVHDPVLQPGRWPGYEVAWGIPPIGSYPYKGSALVYWDSGPPRANDLNVAPTTGPQLGTNPPPIANLPNRVGQDPHELPRRTVEEQRMVSDFLMPNAQSHILDECGGPCLDYTAYGSADQSHRATGSNP
jgi:hypothetical protein